MVLRDRLQGPLESGRGDQRGGQLVIADMAQRGGSGDRIEAIGVGGPPNSESSEGVGEGGAGALPLSSLWTSSLPQLTLRIIGGAFLGGIFDAKCEV